MQNRKTIALFATTAAGAIVAFLAQTPGAGLSIARAFLDVIL